MAEILINGDRIFPAMLEAIRSARRTVNLLTYIYWRGEIAGSSPMRSASARPRGSSAASSSTPWGRSRWTPTWSPGWRSPGSVSAASVRRPYAIRRGNNRTHRKLLLADGRVAFTGGVGIADEWTGDAQDPEHWRDTHVRVEGPVVRGLQGSFAENWLEATGEVIAGEDDLPELEPIAGEGAAMLAVRSSAGVGDSDLETLFFLTIAAARASIDVTSAYFAPRPAFLAALADAARSGIAVRVLVPGPLIDKDVVRHTARSVYGQLLGRGADLRVPAHDAPREVDGGRRRLVDQWGRRTSTTGRSS